MQIAAIPEYGFSVANSGKNESKQSSSGCFSGLLEKLHQDQFVPVCKGEEEVHLPEKFRELISFLERMDEPELEEWLSILNFFPQDWSGLKAFSEQEGTFTLSNGPFEMSVDSAMGQDIYSFFQKVSLQKAADILAEIVSLSPEKIAGSLNGDLVAWIKAVKLFEQTVNDSSLSGGNVNLRELLQQLSEKIQTLLKNGMEKSSQPESKGHEFSRSPYLDRISVRGAPDLVTRIKTEIWKLGGGHPLPAANSVRKTAPGYPLYHAVWNRPEQFTFFIYITENEAASSQFIRQFEQILAKSHFTNLRGTQRLNIKLIPEHLGRLNIELVQREGGMTARIVTATGLAKELLESRIHVLKHMFQQQNLPLEKIEILEQLSEPQEKYFYREQNPHDRRQEEQKPSPRNKREKQKGDFAANFDDVLLSLQA